MPTNTTNSKKYPSLNITCTSTDCNSGLHCFRATKKMLKKNEKGNCRNCGARLVDWNRVYKKNPKDVKYTFKSLKYELIRHHFWHIPIDQRAVNHAKRKGKIDLKNSIEKRIKTSVGTRTAFDGRQTPKFGNSIYYAQHATASCCRRCIEEWHNIPMDKRLTINEIQYLSELCWMYINERIPDLTEKGEKIPPIRKNS